MIRYCLLIIIVINIASASIYAVNSFSEENKFFFRDDFNDLENWKPLTFPKIKEHSEYSIIKDRNNSFLKAESKASASGLVLKNEFNVFEYSKMKWRWKISNIYKKGNASKKSGDDYPIRVYIIFKYNPLNASFGQKIKYGLYKKIYGEYPPLSSLNYIWSNLKHEEEIITNTYANESKMIILQSGEENADRWIEQDINILIDYRRAFGSDPPEIASLAIMNDSDNTGESSVSFIDYIELTK